MVDANSSFVGWSVEVQKTGPMWWVFSGRVIRSVYLFLGFTIVLQFVSFNLLVYVASQTSFI